MKYNNFSFDNFEVTTLEVVKKGGRDKQWLLWIIKRIKKFCILYLTKVAKLELVKKGHGGVRGRWWLITAAVMSDCMGQ